MSSNVPLLFSVTRSSWSVSSSHGTKAYFERRAKIQGLYDQVMKRDDYTCQAAGCGWRCEEGQEIHHRDHNHKNYKLSNLVTLCPMCHLVFHLPQAAAVSAGSMIWLPEITQANLNLLCIGLFVAMDNPKSKMANVARTIYGALESRKTALDEQVGRSDPGVLAQVMLNMTPEQYEQREAWLRPIRFLPYASHFKQELPAWSKLFAHIPQEEWVRFVEGVDLSQLTAKHELSR